MQKVFLIVSDILWSRSINCKVMKRILMWLNNQTIFDKIWSKCSCDITDVCACDYILLLWRPVAIDLIDWFILFSYYEGFDKFLVVWFYRHNHIKLDDNKIFWYRKSSFFPIAFPWIILEEKYYKIFTFFINFNSKASKLLLNLYTFQIQIRKSLYIIFSK